MEDDSNEAMDRGHHKPDTVHRDEMDLQDDIRQGAVHLDEGMDKEDVDQVLPDVVVDQDVRGQVQLDAAVALGAEVELDVVVVQGVNRHRRDHRDVHRHYLGGRHFRDLPDVHHHYRLLREDDLPHRDRRDLNFEIGLCLTIESTDHSMGQIHQRPMQIAQAKARQAKRNTENTFVSS
jgi:hypothetical protein